MEKIRWCIIGAGGIAERRAIPALLLDPQNEIVAVMDTAAGLVKSVADKYGIKNCFTDAKEMFESTECDAVYIATPVFCHYEQAMLALSYGAHVFMEKPIALNGDEGQRLVDAFKAAGKQLTVGYMMGYHNLHKKAGKLIADGKLGEVNLVRMHFSCWYPEIPGAWRQNPKLSGGGCIIDLAVHCMELFHSITGDDIEECKSFYSTKTFNYAVEDSALIAFKSKRGILGSIAVNFNVPDSCAPGRLEIYGTEGSIYATGTLGQEEVGKLRYIHSPQGDYEAQQHHKVSEPKIYYGNGSNIYTKQFSVFKKIVMSGKPDYASAKQALHVQKLCDSIYNEK